MYGKTAVVTGASRGIGVYIARALAARGADLALVARSERELRQLAGELEDTGVRALPLPVDLSDPSAPRQVVDAVAAELGGIDILVNNAALELQRRFDGLTTAEIEQVVRVDLLAPIELAHLALGGMLDRGYGRIVNISSLAGHVGFPFTEAYAASKDGLAAFSRVLRSDYRSRGVSASSIILGAVKDAGLGQRTLDETGLDSNMSFMVRPSAVANAVVRAIEKDKAEIVVMKGPGRLMKALMDYFPGFGPAMNKLAGAEKVVTAVADFREAEHRQALSGARPALGAGRHVSG
jgi:short-subunit dehydrogenase